jgi:hypothetical protein
MRRYVRIKIPFYNPMIESESIRTRHSRWNDQFDAIVERLCVVRSPTRWELPKPIVVVRNVDFEKTKLMIR